MEKRRGAETPPEAAGPAAPGHARANILPRLLPLLLVALALVLLHVLGFAEYLSFDALHRYRGELTASVAARPVLAALAYVAIYVAIVAISFPGAGILTVAGGFLFGPLLGTALASFAATAGATLIFLIARSALGTLLAERAGPRMQALRRGFQEEGFSYLLFLRLVPLFPFWLVNLASALFGMRLLTYVAATAVGVVPATFVFAYLGHGLQDALASEGPRVPVALLVALVLLGFMALAPVALRRWRRGRGSA
jgi:uncharacterized membrane protein YdjX (TVP38/TMEM64 family)